MGRENRSRIDLPNSRSGFEVPTTRFYLLADLEMETEKVGRELGSGCTFSLSS